MKMSTHVNSRASRRADAEEVLQSLLASKGWGATRQERTTGLVVAASARRSAEGPRVDLDMVAGRLAHRTVQGVLQQCPNPTFPEVLELLPQVLNRALERESGLGSMKRRTSIRAEGAAMLYLTRFAPVPSCEFIGAEVDVDNGQVDLVWRHADGRVFFDELKTNRVQVDVQPTGCWRSSRPDTPARVDAGSATLSLGFVSSPSCIQVGLSWLQKLTGRCGFVPSRSLRWQSTHCALPLWGVNSDDRRVPHECAVRCGGGIAAPSCGRDVPAKRCSCRCPQPPAGREHVAAPLGSRQRGSVPRE